MKKIIYSSLCFMLIGLSLLAQTPQAFKYQAVARNSDGSLIQNQAVTFRFSLLQGGASGTLVYQERHLATTNDYGLANVEIGKGTVLYGTFSAIDWSPGQMFMKVELDPAGGAAYTDMGATELLSVPYALYSGQSSSGWALTGNSGTSSGTNFMGTTDNVPLTFKVNNTLAGKIETYNTSLGYQSLMESNGYFLTAIGFRALQNNTTGNDNTAMGSQALVYNTSGGANTAVGSHALVSNEWGDQNTAIGHCALESNLIADECTAVGCYALAYNHGNYNTATGNKALFSNTEGYSNTASGNFTLTANTTGDFNTATGENALFTNSAGNRNTANGNYSLYFTTGNYNTAMGYGAGYYVAGGSRNIAIGFNCGTPLTLPDITNTVSIGNEGNYNSSSNQVFIGNTSTLWNGGNKTWSTYSDARIKNSIKEDVVGLDFILRLHPVTYHRSIKDMAAITGNEETEDFPGKYDVEKIKESGFLAQEVEQAAREAGYDFSGITIPKNDKELYTLSYEEFVVPLVKAMQEQQTMIERLQKQNEVLQNRIEMLERK
jgi:trimeric autotransporter adhesin